MNETFRSTCPMTNLLDLVGDKWSLIVIRDLLLCRNTFSQLIQEGEENISTNILTNRLKKLKNYGFIDFVKNRNDHKVKHYYLNAGLSKFMKFGLRNIIIKVKEVQVFILQSPCLNP